MTRDFFLPRRGAGYVAGVILAGGVVISVSATELLAGEVSTGWVLLAALTLLSGSATVKLPSVPATISISETFVFTSVLLFGPAAGATIVALDGLIISCWFAKKRKDIYRVAFNMAAPALSIWVSAQLYFSFAGVLPLTSTHGSVEISAILFPLIVFTVSHFFINSLLIARAVAFETGRQTLDIWRHDFLWLSLNYFGGASVSALLVVYTRDVEWTYLGIIIPLLLILYFTFKIPMARVEDTNRHLHKVNSLYLSTIETLALAIDAKDQVTHGHIRRVQTFANALAKAIGICDDLMLKAIEASALLHDMGKLAIPEHILNKPGKLSAAEFDKMKLHASIGADILSSIEFPYPVVPIVRHHHENWDGTGYPTGLSGVDIPIGARILSVVDCFDALTSDRPYRPALSDEAAITILLERRGTMYDPLVVDTFVRIHEEVRLIESDGRQNLLEAQRVSSSPEEVHAEATSASSDKFGVFLVHQTLSDFADRNWHDASDLVLHRLSQVVPISKCLTFAYDAAADELVCQSCHGAGLDSLKGLRRKVGEGLSGWVAANRQSIRNSSPALDSAGTASTAFASLESTLSVPLIAHEALAGVLTVYSSECQAYTEYHRELLEGFAPTIGQLVRKSQLANGGLPSAEQAYPGPYHLDTYLKQRFQSSDTPGDLCLLIVNLDHDRTLELENQTCRLGHIVDFVSDQLRAEDMAFVCGPTVLVYALSNACEVEAHRVMTRLIMRVQDEQRSGARVSSVGLVVAPRDGRTLAQLLNAARMSFATIGDSAGAVHEFRQPFF